MPLVAQAVPDFTGFTLLELHDQYKENVQGKTGKFSHYYKAFKVEDQLYKKKKR